MATGRDIVEGAFTEIEMRPPDQPLKADPAAWGLKKLNRLIGRLNSQDIVVPVKNILSFTMVAGTTDYTVGPTGGVIAARPSKIEVGNANVLVNGLVYPVNVGDQADHGRIGYPAQTAPWPWWVYYFGTLPDGTVKVWPVPSGASTLKILVPSQLDAFVTLNDNFDMADGFKDMLTWCLAEDLLTSYPNSEVAPEVRRRAREARAACSNLVPVDMSAATDAPLRQTGRGDRYDFYSGLYR